MRDIISYYFFLFVVYSFVGWVWESVFCSLYARHRLINRGFLNGPYCPIYGTGAVFGLITLSGINNTVILFFAAAVMTCSLEYFTSWAMEKLFNARWWDYSEEPLNINGRVYIGGFIAFGTGIVLLIKVVNPFVVGLMLQIPYDIFNGICALLFIGMVTDFALTLSGLADFTQKVKDLSEAVDALKDTVTDKIQSSAPYEKAKELAEAIDAVKDTVTDKIQSSPPVEAITTIINSPTPMETVTTIITMSEPYEKVSELYEKFSDMLSLQQRRILNAFPTIKSVNHTGVFAELKKITLLKRSKSDKR